MNKNMSEQITISMDIEHDEPPQDQVGISSKSTELPELDPSLALAMLREGKPIADVRISRLKLDGEFTFPLKFKNVVLDRLVFKKGHFHEGVEFFCCTILRARCERNSTFEKFLTLQACTLKRSIFGGLTIKGMARFDRSEFIGNADFNHCVFDGDAKFWEAHTAGWFNFKHCQFHGVADLRSIHVSEGTTFEHCLFQKEALFRGATIEKKLDFLTSHFDGLLDLSKAKLRDFVYLETISQGPAQTFAFANAVVDRMLIKPKQIAGRLASENANNHELAMREYGLLKAIFQTLHRFDEEDWAYYRFKVNQRKGKPRSWLRPWSKLAQICDLVLLDWGCGYGTNPGRAVTSALLMMLFFAALYAIGYQHFEISSPPIADLPADGLVNRVVYALMTTVSVFTSGFGGDQFNTAHGWVLIPLNIEALFGTLLWGLFVVAFSRKVIR
ncbi:MAG: hypothetical protein C0478_08840 [Planctomyces sp.]|nr:hypothetical protein [Planctomyces sp.]